MTKARKKSGQESLGCLRSVAIITFVLALSLTMKYCLDRSTTQQQHDSLQERENNHGVSTPVSSKHASGP
jgi:hypothetical protein